jgi:hypothetical protein
VGKRKREFHAATGKIGRLYVLLRERLVGRAAMNAMVFAIGKYSFNFILLVVDVAIWTEIRA